MKIISAKTYKSIALRIKRDMNKLQICRTLFQFIWLVKDTGKYRMKVNSDTEIQTIHRF